MGGGGRGGGGEPLLGLDTCFCCNFLQGIDMPIVVCTHMDISAHEKPDHEPHCPSHPHPPNPRWGCLAHPSDSLVWWGVQWEAIAATLGTGRTAMACFVQVKKTDQLTKGKGAFTDDEQQRIREGLTLYGQNWAEIASHVGGGRSRQQVMHHFKNVMDVTRKGRWSDEEDRQLASVC